MPEIQQDFFASPVPPSTSVPVELVAPESSNDPNVVFPDGVLEHLIGPCESVVRDALEDRTVPPDLTVPPPEPQVQPQADKPLLVIEQVVGAIKDGRDLSSMKEDVLRLVSNQEDRAQLISNLLMTHDYTRMAKYAKAREKLENVVLEAIEQRQLTPTQTIAFLKLVMEESEVISARIRNGATTVKDLVSLLNRADYAMQLSDAELHKKFEGTTPQGREIIRRLMGRLNKATLNEVKRDSISD